MIDKKYLDLLQKYDSPTICNVIELFKVRPQSKGYMGAEIKSMFPDLPPMVGYAVTAKCCAAQPFGKGDVYTDLNTQIESFSSVPEPRVVVLEDIDEPKIGAAFGEVMASCYQAFGCVGLVTSGGARDLPPIHQRGFPCFASCVIVSHAYPRILEVNVPVQIGGVEIKPGDLLHGDVNGVTTIPLDIAEMVALACEKFVQGEEMVFNYVAKPGATLDGLKSVRAKVNAHISTIVEQVRAEYLRK